MGRPIFNYELGDPDFSWLISTYKENHPDHTFIETTGLPILFITNGKSITEIKEEQSQSEFAVHKPPSDDANSDSINLNKRS